MSLVWPEGHSFGGRFLASRMGHLCVREAKSDKSTISPALFLCVPLYSAYCCDVCVQEVCWEQCYGDEREVRNMGGLCWLNNANMLIKIKIPTFISSFNL